MGDRRRNVELGVAKSVGKRTSKLPVKRRFQVSLRMSASPLHRLQMAENVPALEEGGDSSDDVVETLPHHCAVTKNASGSDSEASDRDEENVDDVASGYLADCEMEPQRQRVSRIQPGLKLKSGIVYC